MRRAAPAILLAVLSPVCAEHLIGYDDITGDPAAMIFGLFIFAPLYGAPAVLIREVSRRSGRGWPTILLLGLAFGLVEAGLIDQSLFSTGYRGIPYWDNLREPTLIPGIGSSASMIVGFLGGHAIGSIGAPIAVAESVVPRRATEPWLGPVGLAVAALLWIASASIVLADTLNTETFRPSAAQLVGTAILVTAVVWFAFTRPRQTSAPRSTGSVPAPKVVGLVSLLCLSVRPALDSASARSDVFSSWLPVLVNVTAVAGFGLLLRVWSSREGWGELHRLAVAAGALIGIGVVAFSVDPLGDGSAFAKYISNVVLLGIVAGLLYLAANRTREVQAARR